MNGAGEYKKVTSEKGCTKQTARCQKQAQSTQHPPDHHKRGYTARERVTGGGLLVVGSEGRHPREHSEHLASHTGHCAAYTPDLEP